MKRYKCIMIEDDIVEQKVLELNLSHLPNVELVQTFSKPSEALPMIHSRTIDLMFVDVELPEMTGLELIKSLENPLPAILTTVHVDFAINAFEIGVIDYLVKPYTVERLQKAVSRAIEVVLTNQSKNKSYFFLKAGRELIKFYVGDIIYIEAYGSFTKVHTLQKVFTMSEPISVLQEKMTEGAFLRVHKSYLVSKIYITGISARFILLDNLKIPLGSYYRESVEEAIGSTVLNFLA
jgi:DNA-binding LytR/AlgR family response regulator